MVPANEFLCGTSLAYFPVGGPVPSMPPPGLTNSGWGGMEAGSGLLYSTQVPREGGSLLERCLLLERLGAVASLTPTAPSPAAAPALRMRGQLARSWTAPSPRAGATTCFSPRSPTELWTPTAAAALWGGRRRPLR